MDADFSRHHAERPRTMGEKLSAAAAFSGSGTAVIFGLTPSEWSVIGVIGGLVVAVFGLFINLAYKHAHYKLALAKATTWSPLID